MYFIKPLFFLMLLVMIMAVLSRAWYNLAPGAR